MGNCNERKKRDPLNEGEDKRILGKQGKVFLTKEEPPMDNFCSFPKVGFGLSGSSQPSPADLAALRTKLGLEAKQTLIDVDVREEPHFFLDGKWAITYEVEPEDAAAWYHSPKSKVEQLETQLVQNLTSPVELYEHNPGTKDDHDTKDKHPVPFSTKSTEAQVCRHAGLLYERAPITDNQRPRTAETDDLVRFFRKAYFQKAWLHFHCRDGHGRTTTALVMYDVFCNSRSKSLVTIVEQHPTCNLLELVSEQARKKATAQSPPPPTFEESMSLGWTTDRADFIVRFYQYCFINSEALLSPSHADLPQSFADYSRSLHHEY